MNKSYRKKITNDIGIVFNVTLTKEKNGPPEYKSESYLHYIVMKLYLYFDFEPL